MIPTNSLSAIEPMLVLSTAHLTPETCNVFLPTYGGPVWAKGEYGWFVYVPADVDADHPADLSACLAFARRINASWVMFDRDQAPLGGLQTFDW